MLAFGKELVNFSLPLPPDTARHGLPVPNQRVGQPRFCQHHDGAARVAPRAAARFILQQADSRRRGRHGPLGRRRRAASRERALTRRRRVCQAWAWGIRSVQRPLPHCGLPPNGQPDATTAPVPAARQQRRAGAQFAPRRAVPRDSRGAYRPLVAEIEQKFPLALCQRPAKFFHETTGKILARRPPAQVDPSR